MPVTLYLYLSPLMNSSTILLLLGLSAPSTGGAVEASPLIKAFIPLFGAPFT